MGPSPWVWSSGAFPVWVLSIGCSPSGAYCSSMGLSLASDHQENFSYMSFSPRAAAPARSLIRCGVSRACIFLQHISTCCGTGSSLGPTVVIYSNGDLNELQGDSLCVSMVITMDCRGICSPALLPPPPFLLTWPLQCCFHDIFPTPLSQCLLRILPFHKYASPEVATVLSWGLSHVLWWLCWSGWNLLFLSQDKKSAPKALSLAPCSPTPGHLHPMVTNRVQTFTSVKLPQHQQLHKVQRSGSLPVFAQKMKEGIPAAYSHKLCVPKVNLKTSM